MGKKTNPLEQIRSFISQMPPKIDVSKTLYDTDNIERISNMAVENREQKLKELSELLIDQNSNLRELISQLLNQYEKSQEMIRKKNARLQWLIGIVCALIGAIVGNLL